MGAPNLGFEPHRIGGHSLGFRGCRDCSSSLGASDVANPAPQAARPRCGPCRPESLGCTRGTDTPWLPGTAGGIESRHLEQRTGPGGGTNAPSGDARPRELLGRSGASWLGWKPSSDSTASSCGVASCSRADLAWGAGRPSAEDRPGDQAHDHHNRSGDEDVVERRSAVLAPRVESHRTSMGCDSRFAPSLAIVASLASAPCPPDSPPRSPP